MRSKITACYLSRNIEITGRYLKLRTTSDIRHVVTQFSFKTVTR